MNSYKKVAILFSKFENFHWEKDPGYISRKLQNIGHEVSVFSTLYFTSPVDQKINTLTFSKEDYFSGTFLRKEEFERLIIYHFDFRYIPLLKIAKELNMKVIIKADHNGYLPMLESDTIRKNIYYNAKKLVKSILNIAYKAQFLEFINLVDNVIIESYVGYRRFVAMFPICASKFVVIPNGYDFPDYVKYEKKNTIVAIGRWDDYKQKRVERLLKAFLTANDAIKVKYTLHLIGPCPMKIQNKYKNENIFFMNKQPKNIIEKELKLSKILLMSSEWEGFPNVIVEAFGFNNTLVSTPFAAASDSVLGGQCGLISEDYTSKDLASALIAEVMLWENNYRFQKEIYNLTSKYFNWSTVVQNINNLITREKYEN